MSLCTYQPFGLQFSFYLLASASHEVTGEAAYSTETTASPQGQGQALPCDCCGAFHLLNACCGKVILIKYESYCQK